MPAIPITYDLFGPQPGTANGHSFIPGTEFAALTAFTASTKSFYITVPTARIEYAEWRVVWQVQSVHRAKLRWHHNDENGMNFTDIGEINPGAGGLIPSALNITAAMQAARASGKYVHVGQTFKGDGAAPLVLYEAHLTIHWRVGYHGE